MKNMENFQAHIVEQHDISATISVEVAPKDVTSAFKKVMQSLSRQIRVPGFRPGKAPRRVILSQIGGEEVLQQEVRSNLFEQFIPKAIEKLELEAIELDKVEEEGTLPQVDMPFVFSFGCQLFPKVQLPDYRSIVLDTEKTLVEDDEVTTFIEGLRENFAVMEPVDGRPVEANDVVLLGLQSSPDDTPPLPMDLSKVSDMMVEQLVGKELDEAFELILDIPRKQKIDDDDIDDDMADDMADDDDETEEKLAVFVQDIRQKVLPECDDDFAETLGQESWQQVESNIRNRLQYDYDSDTFAAQMEEFIEKLLELSEVTIPATIMSDARKNVLRNIEATLEEDGWSLRDYRKSLEKAGEIEKFEMHLENSAYASAKQDLVLGTILDEEDVQIDEQEFTSFLEYKAAQENISLRKFKKELGKNGIENHRYILRRSRAVENVVRDIIANRDAIESADATEAELNVSDSSDSHTPDSDTPDNSRQEAVS